MRDRIPPPPPLPPDRRVIAEDFRLSPRKKHKLRSINDCYISSIPVPWSAFGLVFILGCVVGAFVMVTNQ